MEYLNLEKGGLITILIPLNLLIGEYTLFFLLEWMEPENNSLNHRCD